VVTNKKEGPRFAWVRLASMKFHRAGPRAGLLADGRVWVDGGTYYLTRPPYGYQTPPAEVYDPATDQWSKAPAGLIPAGATESAPAAPVAIQRSPAIVEHAGRRFKLRRGRDKPTVTALPDGNLLVIGGCETTYAFDGEERCFSKRDVDLIDVHSGDVLPGGELHSSSHEHAVVVLPSGAVLVIGGADGDNSTGRVELGVPLGLELAALGQTVAPRARTAIREQAVEEASRRADELTSAGDLEGALAEARAIVERFPDDQYALQKHGEALARLGRHREAIEPLRRALAADRSDAFRMAALARSLVAVGELREALALYRDVAKEADADGDFAFVLGPEARLQILHLSAAVGSDELLEALARRQPEKGASSPEWNNRGAAHERLGRPKQALECFERALEIDPRNDVAASNAARALLQLGRAREAGERCAGALAHDPPDALAATLHMLRGIALHDLGDFEASVASYDRALALDEQGTTVSNRGNSLLKLKRFDEARASYQRAVALGAPHGHYGMACLEAALGRWKEGAAAARQAMKANPAFEAQMRKDPDLAGLWSREKKPKRSR
jgi:tetratricopeptide (TPR) repeat protein